MRRKTAYIVAGLFALALAVAAFFIRKDKQVVVVDPWEAIPSDAFFIIETPDFPEILTKATDPAGLLARLSGMKWAASLADAASFTDSLTGSREVRELISNRKVLLSFHSARQGRASVLAVMSIGASFSPRRLGQLLKQSGAEVSETKELGGTRTLSATFGKTGKKTSVTLALSSGILIVSASESLVADALNNKSIGSDIRHQQGFTQIVNASGKDADNIFVLFRNLPGFIKSFVPEDRIIQVSAAAIAGGGDLEMKEDGVMVSGFLSTTGAGQGLDKINDVTPAECGVHELLPRGTLSYRTIMRRASLRGETASDPASINATDIALALSPYTGSEVTEAHILTDGYPETVMLFRMTDRQTAESVMHERLGAKYRSMGLKESHFLVVAGNGREKEVVMYKMPFTGVASILSGKPSAVENDGWVMFARSYMLFSASPDALAEIRKESDRDNTLINDPEFREMEKTLPTKSSFLFYSSGNALKSLIDQFLTAESSRACSENSLSAIRGLGISLTPSNGMIYTSLSVKYGDRIQEEPGAALAGGDIKNPPGKDTLAGNGLSLLWRVRLDADPAIRPFFFVNHNTGATEIFIQDQKNNLYLISSSGKILWKALIRERVTGNIFMIDYYRNGKNQLLFSGKDYLHLIDRNGSYVDRFPVKMRSPASNTLAVFDYENNKDYRLFIAGEDRKIYVYDRSGTLVRGWSLFTTRGRVTDPVKFFRVRGKDYLFVADDQSVYVLDRTGNIRVNQQEPLIKAKGSSVRVTEGEQQAFIFTSPDGTITVLSPDGTVKKQNISTFSDKHFADFSDLNGDDKTDYVFTDNGILKVYDNSGSEIFVRSFDSDNITGPMIVSFSSSDSKIFVYETQKQFLHLVGKNGDEVPGFPLRAGQYFTTGRVANKNTWNLLVNANDNYLYNYELSTGIK